MKYIGFQKKITEQDKEKYNLENKNSENGDKSYIVYRKPIKLIPTGEDFPVMIGNSKEELENVSYIEFSKIEKVEFAEMYNGRIYLERDELKQAKEKFVRGVKNSYLEKYIDGVISNHVRWAEMKESEQKKYLEYRKYLVNYSDTKNWFEAFPKTWDEYFNIKGENDV